MCTGLGGDSSLIWPRSHANGPQIGRLPRRLLGHTYAAHASSAHPMAPRNDGRGSAPTR